MILSIQQQLGHRRSLSDTIKVNLDIAQEQLEAGPIGKNWFLLVQNVSLVATAATRTIALPLNFNCEDDDSGFWYKPSSTLPEVELKKVTFAEGKNSFTSTLTGPPKAYSIDGFVLNIWPLPDVAYEFSFSYFKKDDLPSITNENLWLKHAHNVLIAEAGIYTSNGVRDANAVAFFNALLQKAGNILANQNEARMHANHSYQMGGPEN